VHGVLGLCAEMLWSKSIVWFIKLQGKWKCPIKRGAKWLKDMHNKVTKLLFKMRTNLIMNVIVKIALEPILSVNTEHILLKSISSK
jgi:hypothetical protein